MRWIRVLCGCQLPTLVRYRVLVPLVIRLCRDRRHSNPACIGRQNGPPRRVKRSKDWCCRQGVLERLKACLGFGRPLEPRVWTSLVFPAPFVVQPTPRILRQNGSSCW